MPIPQEILSVKRPRNTIVVAYGKDKQLYAVRKRIGCRNIDGRHVPVNGPTIGHITDGQFTTINAARAASSCIELKDWAGACLCDRLFCGILPALERLYGPSEAMDIYCISILRVCNPGIRDSEMKEAYENSFLSELHPGVEFSSGQLSGFREKCGGNLIDSLSKNLALRLLEAFDKAEVLSSLTYGEAMKMLKRAKKVRIDNREWQLVKISPKLAQMLESLSLIPEKGETEKRKPGRPRKEQLNK